MEWKYPHEWPEAREAAGALQDSHARRVDVTGNAGEPRLIAAAEATYGHGGVMLYAAALIVTFPEFEEVERAFFKHEPRFPRSVNLSYFHEGPALVGALAALKGDADLIMVYGEGIAHSGRCGTACQIGLGFDKPTIGYVRRLQHGSHRPVDRARGSLQRIILAGMEVGVALRSREDVKPIFISPGHRCDLRFAQDIVTRSLRGFRLPEPVRLAHSLANKYRRRAEKGVRSRVPETVP